MKKNIFTLWVYLFSLILTGTAVVFVKQSPVIAHIQEELTVVKAPSGV